MNITRRKRLIDTENKQVVTNGERAAGSGKIGTGVGD